MNSLIALISVAMAILFGGFQVQAQTTETELELLAQQGDVHSQFSLALLYDKGNEGKSRDPILASKWYLKAARQGHTDAQNSLGSMLQAGDGTELDYDAAVQWYSKAAGSGHAQALNNLGYMYDLGLGVSEDDKRAVDLYRQSAEAGHDEAMLNIGLMYAFGTGVLKDYETAYMWLDLARFYTQQSEDANLKWRVRGYLDELERNLTDRNIKRAKAKSAEWYRTHN